MTIWHTCLATILNYEFCKGSSSVLYRTSDDKLCKLRVNIDGPIGWKTIFAHQILIIAEPDIAYVKKAEGITVGNLFINLQKTDNY